MIGPQSIMNEVKVVETRRDWSQLPVDFKLDAIKSLKASIQPYFRGQANSCIKARILLSQAKDFSEIYKAIERLNQFEGRKGTNA